MMKALWLTSWYPNRLDAQNGDFIQRHALAASLFCNIHVIHLEADRQNVLTQPTEVSVTKNNNLVEEIILYKLPSQKNIVGKLSSYRRYISIFKKHIEAYIQANGKPDIVHVHVPVKAGLLALWIKRKYKIPYLVTEHWAIYNNDAPDAFLKRNVLFKYFMKKILQNASLFTPVSQNLGEAVQKMVVNIPFTVVPNVVDTTLFNRQSQQPPGSAAFTFIHVSTLNYQKNPEGILRAYKQFLTTQPGAKLIMVGGAGEELLSYAASLNIPSPNIHFTGLIPYKQVAEIMKASDALVMFSRYENLPCVITEALCCGLPVISTCIGGIPEVIDESNGLLVEKDDETGLLKAMLQVYENRNAFSGHNISARASTLFSYTTIGENLTALYHRL
jgi:glycosyltransferase involved in cell wall biosynthesis